MQRGAKNDSWGKRETKTVKGLCKWLSRINQSDSLRLLQKQRVMTGLGPGVSHCPAGEVGRPRPHHAAAPPGNQESPPRHLIQQNLNNQTTTVVGSTLACVCPPSSAGRGQTGTKYWQQNCKGRKFFQEFANACKCFGFAAARRERKIVDDKIVCRSCWTVTNTQLFLLHIL